MGPLTNMKNLIPTLDKNKNKKREERKVRMSPNRGDMNARAIREDEVERMGPKEAAAPQTNNQMFCPTDFLKEV